MPYLTFIFFLIVIILGKHFWTVVKFLLFELPYGAIQLIASMIGAPSAAAAGRTTRKPSWIYYSFKRFNLFDVLGYFFIFCSIFWGEFSPTDCFLVISKGILSFAFRAIAARSSEDENDPLFKMCVKDIEGDHKEHELRQEEEKFTGFKL